MVGARVRRQQVAYAVERGLSSRRACALLSVACSTLGYASRLKVGIEEWRRHYNEVRPHSSLGYLTPAEFKAAGAALVSEGRSAATPPRADVEEQTETHDGLTSPLGGILQ